MHLGFVIWVWKVPQISGGVYMANGKLYDPNLASWGFKSGAAFLGMFGAFQVAKFRWMWGLGVLGVNILLMVCYWMFMLSWGE